MTDDRSEKNAIFGATPNVSQPAQTKAAELGLDIPYETVPLPSQGKLYPEGSSLHNRETLDIKSMTAREEDILTSRALIKKGTVVNELIKSCIMDKSIDVDEMILGDRAAVMVAVRITGYGADYTGELTCGACEEKYEHTFDLSLLPVKPLTIEPVRPGANEFPFTLPFSKKQVTFKFLTGADENDINVTAEKLKKNGIKSEVDNLVTQRLAYSVVSYEGINAVERGRTMNAARNMLARDARAFREYVDEHEPGVEMRQGTECPHCGHSEEVTVGINSSFFWPQTRR